MLIATLPLATIAGVDEVGRGALFGPVVSAAVIPPPCPRAWQAAGVKDSKALSARQRHRLAAMIRDTALAAQIGYASAQEIDRLNILNASLLSMQRAILKLNPVPQLCLIDGNRQVPHLTIAQQTLLEGEQHSLAIAAASILAKVWRDELISRLDTQYPGYDLVHNKGYGTSKHRQGLHQYGSSPLHRRSFQPVALYARTMGR